MADNFVQLKTKLGKCRVPVIQHNFNKVCLQKFYLSMDVLNGAIIGQSLRQEHRSP